MDLDKAVKIYSGIADFEVESEIEMNKTDARRFERVSRYLTDLLVLRYDTPKESEILPTVVKGICVLKRLLGRYGHDLTDEYLESKGNYGMINAQASVDEAIKKAAEKAREEGLSEEVVEAISRRVKQHSDQLLKLREHHDIRNG